MWNNLNRSMMFCQMLFGLSYYGVMGILTPFFLELDYSEEQTLLILGAFSAIGPLFAVAGGFVADKFLGAYRGLTIACMGFAAGYLLLVLAAWVRNVPLALSGIALASYFRGLMSPSYPSLYKRTFKTQEDFENGIPVNYSVNNVGAFLGMYLFPALILKAGFQGGFLLSALLSALALGTLVFMRRPLRGVAAEIDQAPVGVRNWLAFFAVSAAMTGLVFFMFSNMEAGRIMVYVIGGAAILYFVSLMFTFGRAQRLEMGTILVMMFLTTCFYVYYGQIMTSLNLVAINTMRGDLFGIIPITPAASMSMNPLWCMVAGPVIALVFSKMEKRGINWSTATRVAIAFVLTAIAFGTMTAAMELVGADAVVRPEIFLVVHLFQAFAEVIVGALVVAFILSVAPRRIENFSVSLFSVAIALSGIFGAVFSTSIAQEKGMEITQGIVQEVYGNYFGLLTVLAVVMVGIAFGASVIIRNMLAAAKQSAVLLCGVLLAWCIVPPAEAAGAERGEATNPVHIGNVGGYAHIGKENAADSYGAGFSMYTAAWPLHPRHPGRRFQSGLFGTWMFPANNQPAPIKLYTDIEGGLGWWRNTEYPTTTPKFIMGGVELNFRGWANGPGAGKGKDWNNPKGHYGVAQLSPWLLFPPDGLNLKQGTCGELFGYGYHPLPLTEPKTTTAGADVPTGNHSWTLFLGTGNFKGPVAFFTPYFWSRASVDEPSVAGMFLDSRPSKANRSLSMETQHILCAQVTDSKGETFARMAPTLFPVGPKGDSLIMHRLSVYDKTALWDGVEAWFNGGDPVDGRFAPGGTFTQRFNGKGGVGWKVYMKHVPKEDRAPFAMDFMKPDAADPYTFRYLWDLDTVSLKKTSRGAVVELPQLYRLDTSGKSKNGKWIPTRTASIEAKQQLGEADFSPNPKETPYVYTTPEDPGSCWKTPGPVAGPFKANLGDGSAVTYHWYRFADQPALLNADLTDEEREALQKKVEKIHAHWKNDRDYLAPPTVGTLADLDPALIVSPPKGMEVGYVPIVTRQEPQ
ncbi:Dipeptide and tripeptide permease B [Pontiella desulfatans]|uniref:Dipeptide and tripeptide permease B n=2 Tax=Pontiella desulfatans TaxID=2750659 RepID=A0A6C2TVN9_PONDE|nr:Dipeptide and tripeptide permease B [Pontiella desulfatans]